MGIAICGACRRPIEERVVNALGKQWHVDHFVCAKCEKPFLGTRHYEKKGQAYCETHYHQVTLGAIRPQLKSGVNELSLLQESLSSGDMKS